MRQPDVSAPVVPARRPPLHMPAGATDCHVHVFGPQRAYPLRPDTHFVPHHTPWPDCAAMLRSIGCQRAVLVQPSVYGNDNRCIEDALEAAGDLALRAVAVVAPDVADAELERLHRLGFRGVRFNLASATKGLQLQDARRLAERVRHLGWHLQFFANFHEQPEIGAFLNRLPVPVVIDHVGRVQAGVGVQSPGFKALLHTLAHENCWVKLSAPYFVSSDFPRYGDLGILAEALLEVAPERVLWGTDWPHISARGKLQADADTVDLLSQWIPDACARQRVLVDNPARLYGFEHQKKET